MDACIRAATARDGDCLSQLETQVLLHLSMHTVGMRIDLVNVIAAAVVGHVDEISWHLLD